MTQRRVSNGLYYLFLGILILFSFFNFSYRFTPVLNADMSINVLMTPGYSLSHDLYAWGQDRGGSLIPMLAHLLCRLTGFSPVSAVSIVHYAILILGFLAAIPLFKSWVVRILFAMAWFFPPWHFIDFVLFPFGTQLSLFFMAAFLLGLHPEMETRDPGKDQWPGMILLQLRFAAASILFILSIWVSDLGIVMILLYFMIPVSRFFTGKAILPGMNRRSLFLQAGFWILAGSLFLVYAKSHSVRIDVYADQPFNTKDEMASSLKIMFSSLVGVFTFSSENFVESLYAWILILGMPVVKFAGIFTNRGWFRKINREWFIFFLTAGILMLIIAVISHWVLLNGVGRRYFVLVYISFVIVMLLIAETTEGRKKRMVMIILAIAIFTGSVSSCYSFYIPKYKPSRISVLQELQTLGNVGLIGEYWNAYLAATPDPVNIKATPHDKDYVRNFGLAKEVLSQPRVFIIKDMWMDYFPDSISQFGKNLVRTGDSLHLGDCWLSQYRVTTP